VQGSAAELNRRRSGQLEVAEVTPDGRVVWHWIPNPDPDLFVGETATRYQIAQMNPFRGGEGIVWDEPTHRVFLANKNDARVWHYEPDHEWIRVLYDPASDPTCQLTGVRKMSMTPVGGTSSGKRTHDE
jgi:hypothetical protein